MFDDVRRDFKVALIFLTRLPVRGEPPGRDGLAASAPLLPVVGALIGAIAGGARVLAYEAGLTSFLAATLALAALALVTGALHEDGLADTADGLGGGRTAERALEIMRDSRLGTFGALALIVVVLARVGALATLATPAAVATALVAAAAVSRALMPLAMTLWPHARRDGQGAMAGRPHRAQAGGALLIGLLLSGLVLPPLDALAACALAGALALALGHLASRRLGGITGDVLGAVQQLGETAFLLALAARHAAG